MEIIYFLLPASILLGLVALAGYFWAAKSGQFEDLDTPSMRLLNEEKNSKNPSKYE